MNIKVINTKDNINRLAPKLKTYKVTASQSENLSVSSLELNNENVSNSILKVGNRIKHIEEPITGTIKFIGKDKLAIVWDDNTRERMSLSEANECLEYVDDIQSIVAPSTPQISDKEDKISDKIESAVNNLDLNLNDTSNTENDGIDIEKIRMQHKINAMEKKLADKQTEDVKKSLATELVNLAIKKGMIDADDLQLELTSIMLLNDESFEKYKQDVLNFSSDDIVDSLQSLENSEDYSGLSEEEKKAKQELIKLKSKGIMNNSSTRSISSSNIDIQSISNSSMSDPYSMLNSSNCYSNESGTRSLAKNANAISFNNQYTIPKQEDQLAEILANSLENLSNGSVRQTIAAPIPVQEHALPGFENLQGLRKPLMPGANKVSSGMYQSPTNTSLNDLFNGLDWTTIK